MGSKLLLWCAVVLMLGHTIVPHHHHENVSHSYCEGHSTDLALAHFIVHFFDIDLGEDHLEFFSNTHFYTSFLPSSPGYAHILVSVVSCIGEKHVRFAAPELVLAAPRGPPFAI